MSGYYRPNIFFITILYFLFFWYPDYSNAQRSKLSLRVEKISEFVGGENFNLMSDTVSSVRLIDTIFNEAVRICEGDLSETLYSLMFAFLQQKTVTIKIPILSLKINYPLLTPSEMIFDKKNKNIPAYFLFDSKYFRTGDQDKLVHFFGSAYLSFNGMGFLSLLIGDYIERFEDFFVEDNSYDIRDMQINLLGYYYGRNLKKVSSELPSSFILLHNIKYILLKTG